MNNIAYVMMEEISAGGRLSTFPSSVFASPSVCVSVFSSSRYPLSEILQASKITWQQIYVGLVRNFALIHVFSPVDCVVLSSTIRV